MNFISKNELKINQTLFNFINEEVLPGTNIKQDDFWNRFAKVVHELAPINKKLR
jgi:malate synthase